MYESRISKSYGHLGSIFLRSLVKAGHSVIAADAKWSGSGIGRDITFRLIDVTNPSTLEGLCDGADIVITLSV